MRAAQVYENYQIIKAHPRFAEVEAHLSEEVRTTLAQVGRTGWVPLSSTTQLGLAIADALGEEEAFRWARASVGSGLQKKYLKHLIVGSRSVFGKGALTGVGRILPLALHIIYRNAGRFTYHGSAVDEAQIKWSHVPELMFARPVQLRLIAAAIGSSFDLVSLDGVCLATADKEKRTCIFTLRW